MSYTNIFIGLVVLAVMSNFGSIAAVPTKEPPVHSVEEQGFDTSPFAEGQSTVILNLVPGQSDYATCAGTYTKLAEGLIRNKPVYYNPVGDGRVIFYTGSGWGITSAYYIFVVINGATGAFYYSQVSYAYEASAASWLPRYTCA